jgi:hypothetical protein
VSIPEEPEDVSLKPVVVVFLAAVLEALSIYAIDLLAAHSFQDKNYAESADALRRLSIRDRLRLLPLIATKSAFTLNVESETVKRLLSLVSRRNAIVHIKPKTHLMPIPLNRRGSEPAYCKR